MNPKVLELFYDVVSPYSWVAFEVICRYRTVWNIDLRLRPGFLGGIMKESGNKPPGLVPNKFRYMVTDLQRLSKFCQVPLSLPQDPFEVMFKKGSLSAMRLVTAIDVTQPEFVEPVSRELWKRIWSRDEDITEPQSLFAAAVAGGMPEGSVRKVLELTSAKEVKSRLQSTTDEVVQLGAFGMPTFVANLEGKPEIFFGSDRFELLASSLGEEWRGPIPRGARERDGAGWRTREEVDLSPGPR